MPHNRLPRLIKKIHPKRPREPRKTNVKLLDAWDQNGSSSGPTAWLLHDDDDTWLIQIITKCVKRNLVSPPQYQIH
jgi:hypothetical protein